METNKCVFKSKSDGYREGCKGFVLDSLSKLYYVCDKNIVIKNVKTM